MTTEEMNEQAMEIIVNAGNGRTLLNKALEALYEGDEELYSSHMEDARKEMVAAHAAQTKVLQSTIEDEEVRPNILFTHAQDTLMTIMSEMNIAKHLEKIVRMIVTIQ
ncbi:PTS lactose/cellobiose transporter subunit IIA [Kineothrix sp. MB12-C1]|uniref:PTS lactose/cellobiose transporter subunit IIA n=1 Tax=Kineothrix sp. MB12-C1 TaxID=3070215 RepID=UPI0027D2108E|nr:PTS lactose/cellobiose transporter subunit IIA [Kineothrix sp. MB12-C1]WMC92140.1 PTS lactose/cellobiose transporter subunit IIA [Kineothrix sp. MB12-C1]